MYVQVSILWNFYLYTCAFVPEEKAGFSRSQGLRCSKYGVPNGMGMNMCRFINCSMATL